MCVRGVCVGGGGRACRCACVCETGKVIATCESRIPIRTVRDPPATDPAVVTPGEVSQACVGQTGYSHMAGRQVDLGSQPQQTYVIRIPK